ncbi:MAG: tripartite tricarboxylate transporter substrate binding protein [Comamonadaceae bacterium]|nr:MAG: tripartite tricarboxylate transporter substrate binding protein [Comamonadaceae bacterium]
MDLSTSTPNPHPTSTPTPTRDAATAEPSQRRRQVIRLFGAGAATALAGAPLLASAQAERPMRFIVPFPAGTTTDAAARLFGKVITDRTGRPVTIENRPGANGVIAVQAALAAPADGNTVFIGANSTLSTNAAAFKKLAYDPVADFSLVGFLVLAPCFLMVPAHSRFDTVAQLVAEARRRPKALNYAAGSVTYQLISEWLNDLAKIQATAIPFKGSNEARVAVVAGEVDYALTDASEDVASLVKAGRLKVLMHTSTERSPLLPDVPSAVEAGYPDFIALTWSAAAVSSKTPAPLVESLRSLIADCARSPEVREFYAKRSMPQLSLGGGDMQKYQREEVARWNRIVAATGFERQ